jgi:hypothetical protein
VPALLAGVRRQRLEWLALTSGVGPALS